MGSHASTKVATNCPKLRRCAAKIFTLTDQMLLEVCLELYLEICPQVVCGRHALRMVSCLSWQLPENALSDSAVLRRPNPYQLPRLSSCLRSDLVLIGEALLAQL